MKNILTYSTLAILLLTSCQKEEISIIGTYESKEFSKLKLAWMGLNNEVTSVGNTLQINEDSSFYLQTCGNIVTGKWIIKEDTISLIDETNRWRNDSLHLNGFENRHPEISIIPTNFLIKIRKISRKMNIKFKGQNKLLIEELEKI